MFFGKKSVRKLDVSETVGAETINRLTNMELAIVIIKLLFAIGFSVLGVWLIYKGYTAEFILKFGKLELNSSYPGILLIVASFLIVIYTKLNIVVRAK